MADNLVLEVYRATAAFPTEERFVPVAQIRRAALSAAANIVEGCARRSEREYLHLLNVATGSAAEAEYLLSVAARLDLVSGELHTRLGSQFSELMRGLQKLISSLQTQS
jgi:four helix bundle protein